MKSIYLIRHAKSSWGDFTVPDFDRTLNERGLRDAPDMAKRLLHRKLVPDAFVSSPAKRAKKTCKIFCETMDLDSNKIIFIEDLYHASIETYQKLIVALSNDYKKVAIFSHNPGITDFANTLCKGVHIDNIPTCGIFAVEADIKEWKDFLTAEKNFLFFDYPKAG